MVDELVETGGWPGSELFAVSDFPDVVNELSRQGLPVILGTSKSLLNLHGNVGQAQEQSIILNQTKGENTDEMPSDFLGFSKEEMITWLNNSRNVKVATDRIQEILGSQIDNQVRLALCKCNEKRIVQSMEIDTFLDDPDGLAALIQLEPGQVKQKLLKIGFGSLLNEKCFPNRPKSKATGLPPRTEATKPGAAVNAFRINIPPKMNMDNDEDTRDPKWIKVSLLLLNPLRDTECIDGDFLQSGLKVLWRLINRKNESEMGFLEDCPDRLTRLFHGPEIDTAMKAMSAVAWARLGGGRFGTVYSSGEKQVVKVIQLDNENQLARALNEIQIMLLLFNSEEQVPVVQILDYGVLHSQAWIVMQRARCSLAEHRLEMAGDLNLEDATCFLQCLGLFRDVVEAVHKISQLGVVHYDLRSENCLIMDEPNRVVLGDFGESILFDSRLNFSSRGTECIKSPEMLRVCQDPVARARAEDRRKEFEWGTSFASDVWSLGCLLYQILMKGEFLYEEALHSWAQFFVRLCREEDHELDIIPDDKLEKLASSFGPAHHDRFEVVVSILRFALVRDPRRRPTALALQQKLETKILCI